MQPDQKPLLFAAGLTCALLAARQSFGTRGVTLNDASESGTLLRQSVNLLADLAKSHQGRDLHQMSVALIEVCASKFIIKM